MLHLCARVCAVVGDDVAGSEAVQVLLVVDQACMGAPLAHKQGCQVTVLKYAALMARLQEDQRASNQLAAPQALQLQPRGHVMAAWHAVNPQDRHDLVPQSRHFRSNASLTARWVGYHGCLWQC